MILDPDLPKTRQFPLDPETGKLWKERDAELSACRTALQFCRTKKDRKAWEKLILLLSEGVTFREVPYLREAEVVIGPDPLESRLFFCHPETWEGMSPEQKERFEMEWVE